MLNNKTKWTGFTAAITIVCLLVITGCITAQNAKTTSSDSDLITSTNGTNAVVPGPDDGSIAYVTARILGTYHYLQEPLDTQLSIRFFDEYIDTLDPRRENFLQSDLAEFDHYRTNLDSLTVGVTGNADLTPAYAIYRRFSQRLTEHANYVFGVLKDEKFKFNSDEKIVIDRRHMPFPKNLEEAKVLWRERLRYEFLYFEKLNKEFSPTNDTLVVPLPNNYEQDIAKTLEKHYRWELRSKTNLDHDAILSDYLNALTHAYDPHSDYFSPPHAQDFSIDMNLGLTGIGAQLQEVDGFCTINDLIAGGPAKKSKELKLNDRIVAVAQSNQPPVDVIDMDLEKVVRLIRGPKGTQVRLTISTADNPSSRHEVRLVRDEIKLEDRAANARLIEIPDGMGHTNRIGFLDLPSFYAPMGDDQTPPSYTSVDVAKLVTKLKQQKIDGLIIDLRTNPGGSLEEAIKFTGLFIKDGPVVQARNSDGQITVDSDNDSDELYDGPLAIMINRYSASAAEIAAAALQDYGRAIIIGDSSTHGKGTVQQLLQLKNWLPVSDPGTAKVTIRKFYRVSGASTQLKGVVPDIILPDVLNFSTMIGETNLDYPLPWDTIAPATYEKLNLVGPYVSQLKAHSDLRVSTNQDFKYVAEDIDRLEKLQSEKSVTLNEHEAIEERLKYARVNEARKKERDSRGIPNETIYEITLANSKLPGLPAPTPYWDTNKDLTTTGASSDTNSTSTITTNTIPAVKPTMLSSDNLPAAQAGVAAAATADMAPPAAKPGVTKPFQPDPVLEETERIMLDYIGMLSANKVLTVTK
jgi:carboxyl-terminal processing protease